MKELYDYKTVKVMFEEAFPTASSDACSILAAKLGDPKTVQMVGRLLSAYDGFKARVHGTLGFAAGAFVAGLLLSHFNGGPVVIAIAFAVFSILLVVSIALWAWARRLRYKAAKALDLQKQLYS